MLIRILLPLCLIFAWAHAESIKSITGNIIFDINNDGTSEAKLTSDGLAIGDGLSPSSNLHVQGNVINTGDLVVGGTAGNSTLEIQGTIGYTHQTVSSNTTLSGNSVVLVDTSSDNVTVTLPYAGNVTSRQYVIKKASTSNEITLNGGGNNIDSSSSYTFSSGNSSYMKVISNGSQWYVLSQSGSGLTSVPPLWTPAEISTSAWYDASDSSTVLAGGSDNVYQWNDKSGNGHHLTQSDSAKQPTTNSEVLNSLNVLDFNVDSLQVDFGSTFSQPNTIYLVANTDVTSAGWADFYDGSTSTDRHFLYRNGTNLYAFSGLSITGSLSNTNSHVFTNIFNGASSSMYVDGNTPVNGNKGTQGITGITVGSRHNGSENLDGKFAELIIIDGLSDDDTRQKVEGYLAWKWGLEANLPSGHPYENAAP